MDNFLQDVRQTMRSLMRSPVFTVIAIATLALGIGANTAIYSLVHHVLFKPLPYLETDRLVALWEVAPNGNDHNEMSPGAFLEMRSGVRSLDKVVAYGFATANITGDAGPERVQAIRVSPDFFEALGMKPLLGRGFIADEGELGKHTVAVLTHALWVRRFGSDSSVIGKKLFVNGTPREIVGVLQPGQRYPAPAELYVPLAMSPEAWQSKQAHYLLVTGRLAPGATIEQASAEVAAVSRSLAERFPDSNTNWGSNVQPFVKDVTRLLQPVLLALLAAVGFVLLIACANTANLLLARSAGRQQELFVCAALGASRWRLARRVLTESFILSTLGGALGVLLAVWGVQALVALVPQQHRTFLTGFDRISIDGAVLMFAMVVIIATAMLFGALPALRASRVTNLDASMRASSRTLAGGNHRARSSLIALEVGLALVLLVGAGLALRGFTYLSKRDIGIETDRAALMAMQLPANKYTDVVQQRAFWTELIDRAAALPGASVAAVAHIVPLCSCGETNSFSIVGAPPFKQGETPDVGIRLVSHDYFRSLGVELLRGRSLESTDRAETQRVIVVNESFEKRFFPDGAIGRQLRVLDTVATTIVGVVADVRHRGPAVAAQPEFFLPYTQTTAREMTLIVRSELGEPSALLPAMRELVTAIDPDLPVYDVRTMSDLALASVGPVRLAAWLLSVMASLALVLSAVGINGVVAQLVAERRREIGIRMALGGNERSVVLLVMKRGLFAVSTGLAAGLTVSVMLGLFVRSQLVGVMPVEPVTFFAVPLILATTALAATWLPARRAARVNPVVALRSE